MHSYDLEGRSRVVVILAAASFLLVWMLDVSLGAIDFDPQWWLSVPSFGGFFSGIYWLFDRSVWKWNQLRHIGFVDVPDLNGKWSGEVETSFGQTASSREISILIQQRWSRIVITLETAHSRSRSVTASLRTDGLPNPELTYVYINEPRSNAPDTMNMHRGTASLELKSSALEGDYYTGRGRRQIGTIRLTRV